MNKTLLLTVFFSLFTSFSHADPSNNSNLNTKRAKADYQAFLKQLKELNAQYKQVTGEMAQILKEEEVSE